MKTKRERFEEVAGKRIQMVIERIDSLSNCANKRSYEFTQKDVEKMFKAIHDQLRLAKQAFENELNDNKKDKKVFKF